MSNLIAILLLIGGCAVIAAISWFIFPFPASMVAAGVLGMLWGTAVASLESA